MTNVWNVTVDRAPRSLALPSLRSRVTWRVIKTLPYWNFFSPMFMAFLNEKDLLCILWSKDTRYRLYYWDKEANCLECIQTLSNDKRVILTSRELIWWIPSQISEMCLNLPRLTRQSHHPLLKGYPKYVGSRAGMSQNPPDWRACDVSLLQVHLYLSSLHQQ